MRLRKHFPRNYFRYHSRSPPGTPRASPAPLVGRTLPPSHNKFRYFGHIVCDFPGLGIVCGALLANPEPGSAQQSLLCYLPFTNILSIEGPSVHLSTLPIYMEFLHRLLLPTVLNLITSQPNFGKILHSWSSLRLSCYSH